MTLKGDPLWADVTPVELNAVDGDLAVINLSSAFIECHSYFYALYHSGEKSERCLNITAEVIRHNSANYTAWYWRRKCLEDIDCAKWSDSEIAFANDWAIKSPKNYQVWFHRRWLVEQLKSSVPAMLSSELQYLDKVFDEDSKNYNAWSHRLFVTTLFGTAASEEELQFTDVMLVKDIRNNSAWSYRRQLLDRMHPEGLNSSRCLEEVAFCLEALELTPDNESPWCYLRSLPGWHEVHDVETFCERRLMDMRNSKSGLPLCRHALGTLFELSKMHDRDTEHIIRDLIENDPIRQGYWQYLLDNLAYPPNCVPWK